MKHKRLVENNRKVVSDFVSQFYNLNNREPMESEVIDNLKDTIDADTIRKILGEVSIV